MEFPATSEHLTGLRDEASPIGAGAERLVAMVMRAVSFRQPTRDVPDGGGWESGFVMTTEGIIPVRRESWVEAFVVLWK